MGDDMSDVALRGKQYLQHSGRHVASLARRRLALWRGAWSGLQGRMTLSYVWVTVVLVLLLLALLALTLASVFSSFVAPYVYTLTARQTAEQYAYGATLQANDTTLNPAATFQADQPGSLVLPEKQPAQFAYRVPVVTTHYPVTRPVAFALLVAADGKVIASSYPQRYPIHTSLPPLPLNTLSLIADIHAGASASGGGANAAGRVVYATAIVWSRSEQPIGAVYVQLPGLPSLQNLPGTWRSLIWALLVSALLLLAITAPIGAAFGARTTRGVVRRIKGLAAATTQFAAGHSALRVPVGRRDEIGQLEHDFNQMAGQLVASSEQRQALAGQNARLEERARISRELHDAISQDLFSLRLLCGALRTALATDATAQRYVEPIEEATTRMIREMRALLLELRPGQLDAQGLSAALAELAAAYSARLGMRVTTDISPVTLDARTEHALLRIAQEALANAARHANAATVTLRLRATMDTIEFKIADDGVGFVSSASESEGTIGAGSETHYGLGLRLMRERVEELHGEFSLTTTPGQGTQIAIRLPHSTPDVADMAETLEEAHD